MIIDRFDDDDALSGALATYVLERIVSKPSLVLGLPTGRTPLGLYRELRERSGGRGSDVSSGTYRCTQCGNEIDVDSSK